eukprot:6796189-Ditylum_brightwellii.AAC.2
MDKYLNPSIHEKSCSTLNIIPTTHLHTSCNRPGRNMYYGPIIAHSSPNYATQKESGSGSSR